MKHQTLIDQFSKHLLFEGAGFMENDGRRKNLRFGEGKNNLKRGAEAVQNLNVAFLMNNRIVP